MADDEEGRGIKGSGLVQRQHPAGFDQYYVDDPNWNLGGATVTQPFKGNLPSNFTDLKQKSLERGREDLAQQYDDLNNRALQGDVPFTVNLHNSPDGPQPLPKTTTQRHENIHAIDSLIGRDQFLPSNFYNNTTPLKREARRLGSDLAAKGRGSNVSEVLAYGAVEPPSTRSKIFPTSSDAVPGVIAGLLDTVRDNSVAPEQFQLLMREFDPQSRREIESALTHHSQLDRNLQQLQTREDSDMLSRIAASLRD